MINKILQLVLLAGFSWIVSCKKDQHHEETKTASQLLTAKEWILTGHGFDDNGNKQIDPSENTAADCLKDNTYIFRPDGSGSNFENEIDCGNGQPQNNFTWKLVDSDSAIELNGVKSKIRILTETRLVICPFDSISVPVKDYLVDFKR